MAAVLISFAAGLVGAAAFARGIFLAGGGLLAAGVAALLWPRTFWNGPEPPELARRDRWLLLSGVVAIAALFRFHRMVPPGLWGDDAINGILALDVLDGRIASPFAIVQHSQNKLHALTNFIIAGAFRAFGPGLGTLRLPGVIMGFLCVPLVYGTFAPLFGARAALCAALFFGVSPMQIANSKALLQVVTGEFLLMLGMCPLVQGLMGKRRWLIPLAGVPLGLAHCTYHSYKLAPVIAVAAAVFLVFSDDGGRRFSWRRRSADRGALPAPPPPTQKREEAPRGRGGWWCLAGLVVLVAAATPGLLAYAREPAALTDRVNTSIIGTLRAGGGFAPIWDSIWRTLTIFHYEQGPRSVHWVGIGTDPALDVILAALVCHGFVQSLVRCRQPRHLLLLAWFFIGLLPGMLSTEAPRIYRVVIATPPVFLWAALPVARLLEWATLERSRVAAAIAGLVLVAVPINDFNYYFYGVYTYPGYIWTQAGRMVDMAQTMRAYGPGWTGYLMAVNFDARHESLSFLSRIWKLDLRDVTSPADLMPARQDADIVVLADVTAAPLLESVATFYPGATVEKHRLPRQRRWWFDGLFAQDQTPPEVLTAILPLPKSAIESVRGVRAMLFDAEGTPLAEEVWPQVAWPPPARGASRPVPPARASLSAALYAPREGTYTFTFDGNARASLSIDGRPLLSPGVRKASLDLVEGLHAIGAAVDLAPTTKVALRWQPPGEPAAEVPAAFLRRDSTIHGWLAEYSGKAGRLRRLEPLPRYTLFPRTFDGPYSVRMRGGMVVPEGGRHLEIQSRGTLAVTVDGKPWAGNNGRLEAGVHDFDLTLTGLEGSLFLDFLLHGDPDVATRVEAEAFLPPSGTTGN